MTIQEFYTHIGGDYDDVLLRLPSEELVVRFLQKFVADKTFSEFAAAVASGNVKQSFETAHKLKGIAANLAFTKLHALTSTVCEELRTLKAPANEVLVKGITCNYNSIIEEIGKLDA